MSHVGIKVNDDDEDNEKAFLTKHSWLISCFFVCLWCLLKEK